MKDPFPALPFKEREFVYQFVPSHKRKKSSQYANILLTLHSNIIDGTSIFKEYIERILGERS